MIHTAAVGDFSVADAQPDVKIASGSELSVKLQPTHKIIDRIMGYAGNPDLILVGFKLTHEPDAGAQARAARELLKRSRARYVVQNDVSTLADGEEHLFFVHENGSSRVRRYVGREKLATALAVLIEEQVKGTRDDPGPRHRQQPDLRRRVRRREARAAVPPHDARGEHLRRVRPVLPAGAARERHRPRSASPRSRSARSCPTWCTRCATPA